MVTVKANVMKYCTNLLIVSPLFMIAGSYHLLATYMYHPCDWREPSYNQVLGLNPITEDYGKFYLRLIFAISADEANLGRLKASKMFILVMI